MKYAWIENGQIRDLCSQDPSLLFHPSVASHYSVSVPDNAESGDSFSNGELTKQVVTVAQPTTAPVTYSKVSPVEFKLLFTVQERVALKALRATNPIVDDFFSIVDDPRLSHVDLGLNSTQQALGYLAMLGAITEARVAEILSGTLQ